MASISAAVRSEVREEARLRPSLGEKLHGTTVEVADDREVLVPLGDGLLVDADSSRETARLARAAASHGALHEVMGLVPADAEDLRRARDVGLEQYVDGEALEQQREPRTRLRPRHARLPHSVLGALHARDPRAKHRRELAAVEVPPRPLLGVVVDPKLLATLRTCELLPGLVLDEHIDALLLHREVHARHPPLLLDPQQMTVQLGVLHPISLRGGPQACQSRPTEKPDAPGI